MLYISFNGGKKFPIYEDSLNLDEMSRWLISKTGYVKHKVTKNKNGKKYIGYDYQKIGDPIDFAILYNETERCLVWTRDEGTWKQYSIDESYNTTDDNH